MNRFSALRATALVVLLAFALSFVACGGGTPAAPGTQPPTPGVTLGSITLTAIGSGSAAANTVQAGSIITYTITGHMSDNSTETIPSNQATWTANNQAATVDSNGNVLGVVPGVTVITATVDGETANVTVVVIEVNPNLQRVDVLPSTATISVGGTKQFSFDALDGSGQPIVGGTGIAVTWFSSDATVATVDSNGLATGLKAGTATIRVTVNGLTRTITNNPATLTVN